MVKPNFHVSLFHRRQLSLETINFSNYFPSRQKRLSLKMRLNREKFSYGLAWKSLALRWLRKKWPKNTVPYHNSKLLCVEIHIKFISRWRSCSNWQRRASGAINISWTVVYLYNCVYLFSEKLVKRFSNDCWQRKTKAFTPNNHNRSKQRDEPIRISSSYL